MSAKTVPVRVLHACSIPNARWCEPIGWQPANAVVGADYSDGSWWDDAEEVAGLIWLGGVRGDHGAGEVIEADLADLRIATCYDCRVLGKVKL